MHALCSALALVATLAGPGVEDVPARAAIPGVLRVVLDGGLVRGTRPTSFESTYQPGRGLGIGLDWAPPGSAGSWGGPAAWVRLGWARSAVDQSNAWRNFYGMGPNVRVAGGELDLWSLETGLRLRSGSGSLRPYFDAGVGAVILSTATARVTYTDGVTGQPGGYAIPGTRKTHPATTLGAGLLLQASRSVGVALDVHWEIIRTPDPTHVVPVRLSLFL